MIKFLIFLPHKSKEKKITIAINKQSGISVERQLAALYESGYDEVRIESQDPNIVSAIQKYLEHFIGFEVIELGRNFCVIKNIVGELEREFEPSLRRLFLVVIGMGERLCEILEKKEYNKVGEITARLITVEKLSYLCMRLLNKKGYKEYERAISLYALIRHLRRIADDFFLVKLRLF